MEIYSKYLQCNFTVATQEVADSNSNEQSISHASLMDIVHNQIPSEYGIQYDYSPIVAESGHPVMMCTFCDAKGRRVQAIGEASSASLETDIARKYPVLMASQRAFDRAAILYLDFPGKVFANIEAGDAMPVNLAPAAYPNAAVSRMSTDEQPPVFGNASVSVNQSENTVDAGKVLINLGKYANKMMTVEDIYKCGDVGWLEYMATKAKETAANTDQIRAMRNYLNQRR